MDAVWMQKMAMQMMKWRKNHREMAKNSLVEAGGQRSKFEQKTFKKHENEPIICDGKGKVAI